MKKRILALLLAATMAFGMVGCAGKTDDNQGTTTNTGSENAGDQGQTSENAGFTLFVCYFFRSFIY